MEVVPLPPYVFLLPSTLGGPFDLLPEETSKCSCRVQQSEEGRTAGRLLVQALRLDYGNHCSDSVLESLLDSASEQLLVSEARVQLRDLPQGGVHVPGHSIRDFGGLRGWGHERVVFSLWAFWKPDGAAAHSRCV